MQRALCVYVKAELYMRKNYRPYALRSFIRKDVIFEITYVTQHENCVCLSWIKKKVSLTKSNKRKTNSDDLFFFRLYGSRIILNST